MRVPMKIGYKIPSCMKLPMVDLLPDFQLINWHLISIYAYIRMVMIILVVILPVEAVGLILQPQLSQL